MGRQYLNGILYGTGEIIKFSPYIYSTEEREIGVFIDGKPLYQKTLITTAQKALNSSSWTNIFSNPITVDGNNANNLDTFVFGSCREIQGTSEVMFENGIVRFRVSSGGIIQAAASQSFTLGIGTIFIVQYTKTTDTAGSGHYTTEGGEASHYSQTEQVVGTWIDGTAVYEKTYVFSSPLAVQTSWTVTDIDSTDFVNVVGVIGIHDDGTCYNDLCADPTRTNHTRLGLMAYMVHNVKKLVLRYTK